MGLFSSDKRISVGTQVARVIKDGSLPDAVKSGLVSGLFSGGDLPAHMMESLINSVGIKAEQLYEYGKTRYTHGLPSGAIYSAIDGKNEVTAVLAALSGGTPLIDYSHFRPRNFMHIAWLKIIAEGGYDPVTNKSGVLTASLGTDVWLDDMMVVIPSSTISSYQPGALEQWGTPARAGYTPERPDQAQTGGQRAHTPYVVSDSALYVYVRVEYIYEGPLVDKDTGKKPLLRGFYELRIDDYVVQADYFHVKYSVNGAIKYWMYKVGSGTHPSLDNLFNKPATPNGTFFPFAYYRYNSVSEIADKTTPAYKTSKKLVKYIGMNYDKVAKAIDENPDIGQVVQAMSIMAVPASTTVAIEQRYLFSFFDNLFYSVGNQYTDPGIARNQQLLSGSNEDFVKSSLVIQDKRFKMALSNAGVFKKRVAGVLGPIGTHTSAVGTVVVEEKYKSGWQDDFAIQTRMVNIPTHLYRRQITKDLYDEISVHDLKMQYYVFGEYFVTAKGSADILLIPLDHSITKPYPVSDRELLYSRSLHFVFNSMQETVVEWYQKSFFSAFLQILSFVVIVLSFGSATGPMASLMAAIQAGTTAALTAAVIALVQQLLIGILISFALKLFVKAVGGDLAILIAIASMVYAAYDIHSAGSLRGAPGAQQLLQLSNGLTKAVSANLQDNMRDLLAEYQSFNLFKDEATKQLEAANKLLEHNNWLNPFVIFGEKPDDYYNRTVHSGNTGVAAISAISSYVDIALTLPKLDQTTGELKYG